jgi:hypothetical protein
MAATRMRPARLTSTTTMNRGFTTRKQLTYAVEGWGSTKLVLKRLGKETEGRKKLFKKGMPKYAT